MGGRFTLVALKKDSISLSMSIFRGTKEFNPGFSACSASESILRKSDSAKMLVPNFFAASIFELCSSAEIR